MQPQPEVLTAERRARAEPKAHDRCLQVGSSAGPMLQEAPSPLGAVVRADAE